MIVIDASAVLEWLLLTPHAERVRARFLTDVACAPHLLDLEVAHTIRRLVLADEIAPERGTQALADLSAMFIIRYPHVDLLSRIWELRNNLTAYDAAYVALAEHLDAPLVTCDRRMATAAGHRASVEVI